MAKKNIIVAIYTHPEAYPPTLNAIQELSNKFDSVYIIFRNVFPTEWIYPTNVKLIKIGKFITIRESENQNLSLKINSFLKFTFCFFRLILLKKPDYIQVCDVIPLFSLKLILPLLNRRIKLWYHNHDVAEISLNRKYSIGWFAAKYESDMFPIIDIFTLPSIEREKYFPINKLKGKYYFLPNYPSLHFYNKFICTYKVIENEIRLVYQGSISPGHGLEEIISIINKEINNKILTLHLKGFISDSYKLELIELANSNLVSEKLFFYPVTSYQEVPRLASTCHIGIGIHTGTDIMNSSLGTSSNKIYEYAALGLPVLLYDNKHFSDILGRYEWASFTNLKRESLIKCIVEIDNKFSYLSKAALDTFNTKLNFELYFKRINFNEIE